MAADVPGSPLAKNATTEEALAWYKSQYEELEQELKEFQQSSKELEAELEKDLDAADKRERALQQKAEGLSYEVEEWKVCLHVWLSLGSHDDDPVTVMDVTPPTHPFISISATPGKCSHRHHHPSDLPLLAIR